MSDYNLKLKVWTKGEETRVYVNGKFVEYRSVWSFANSYFYKREDGSCGWKPAFKQGPWNMRQSEENAMAMEEISKFFSVVSFDELLKRLVECQTKGGNVSIRQYEKKFVL